MAKVLTIDYRKCTGCRLCELVCSVRHEGVSNPARSRIKVVKWEWEGQYVPTVCDQCEAAPCVTACLTGARYRDEETGRVALDYERCIGCRTCLVACPHGVAGFDPVDRKVIACDLCDGEPQCARFCQTGAITYVESSDIREKQPIAED